MNVFQWLISRMSPQYRAMWLYRRGMMHAKLHRNQAAIDDYTAVIGLPGDPSDIRAMALFNRALVYHAMASQSNAIVDLRSILEMRDAPEHVKTEARRKLVRMDRS